MSQISQLQRNFLRNFCHQFSATFGFFERNFLGGLTSLQCLSLIWCFGASYDAFTFGLIFSIYTSPLATIAQVGLHNVFQQQQLPEQQAPTQMTHNFVTLSSINHCDSITKLKSCLSSLHASFCGNGMALNPTKPDVILFGTPQRLKSVSADPDFLYVVQDVFEIISTNFQLCTTCNFFPNLTKKCPNSTGLLLPLMQQIQSSNYQAVSGSSGLQALRLIQISQWDLILRHYQSHVSIISAPSSKFFFYGSFYRRFCGPGFSLVAS